MQKRSKRNGKFPRALSRTRELYRERKKEGQRRKRHKSEETDLP